jgi:ABC-type multidrug transport system ATPase subunit
MPVPAIVVESLEKYFPPAYSGWRALVQPIARPTQRALAGISLDVPAGASVAVVGPNGAGKSTLLRILATLILPTRGRALMAGVDVETDAQRARQQFGYHGGGDEGFYGRLTANENLAFFAALNNLRRTTARESIRRVAEWMGIAGELHRQVRTLSTGIVHRLGLARALLHGPGILLLDEPTRSLDPLAASEFRRLLKEDLVRGRGTTLLFASHSLAEVEEIADRVVLLSRGRMAAFDTIPGLLHSTGAATLETAVTQILRQPIAAEVPS